MSHINVTKKRNYLYAGTILYYLEFGQQLALATILMSPNGRPVVTNFAQVIMKSREKADCKKI